MVIAFLVLTDSDLFSCLKLAESMNGVILDSSLCYFSSVQGKCSLPKVCCTILFFFFLWFYFIFILYRHFHKRGRVFLLSIYYPLIIDICNNHDLLLVTSRLFTTSVLLYFLQNARESNVSFKIPIQYRLRYKNLSTTYLNWISVP